MRLNTGSRLAGKSQKVHDTQFTTVFRLDTGRPCKDFNALGVLIHVVSLDVSC